MIKIIINGACGRMGRTVAEVASERPEEFEVVAGIDKFAKNCENSPFPIYESFDESKEDCDCIVDFSLASALPSVVEAACARSCALVVGTTGLQENDMERLRTASSIIPVFNATNMSLGVNLQIDLVKRAAAFLGEAFDVEIVEKHHKIKVDAPSGTAMTLAEEIASVYPSGKELIFERHSRRQKRGETEIGIHAVRGGSIVGEHEVFFIGEDEILKIEHIAQSKRIFVGGALRASAFIVGKAPAFYTMSEMLAEEKAITNISVENDQCIITLSKVPYANPSMADIFASVSQAGANVDMISQSLPNGGLVDIAFTLPEAHLSRALAALASFPFEASHSSSMAKLCIEGAGMEHQPGVAASVFKTLANENIPMHLVTTSETKISVCLDQKNAGLALEATSTAFSL